jgi:predicted nucleotidyltransferase
MLQKRNDLLLVATLAKEASHIRKLAKDTDMTPPTVMRTLKQLQTEKVVDHHTEGKNTIYTLQESPEAKQYQYMAEHYKLLQTLKQPHLRRIIKALIEHTSGELIILFGSQAKGLAKKTSDIDLFIETKNKELKQQLSYIASNLSIKTGTLDPKTPLAQEIQKNHVIIQGVERYYQIIQ